MKKMVIVTYNEAIDADVMEALELCCLRNYTKILGAYGKGEASGTHLGNDIWPGRNNILYIVCDKGQADAVLDRIRALRTKLGKEGVKAFVIPVEEMT